MSGEARHLCRHNAANPEDRHTSLCFRQGNKRLKGKNIQITGHSSRSLITLPEENGVAVVKITYQATVPRNTEQSRKVLWPRVGVSPRALAMPCVQPLPIGVCGQRMSGEARHLCRHNAANGTATPLSAFGGVIRD